MSTLFGLRPRTLVGAAALLVSTGVALSSQAGISGGIITAAQVANLTRECNQRIGAIGNLTVHAPLLNMAHATNVTAVTVEGTCSVTPIMQDGNPNPVNDFALTYSRHIGSATGPLVYETVRYLSPTAQRKTPDVSIPDASEGQCEYQTVTQLEERGKQAGINVDAYLPRYRQVAETNCQAIRDAIVSCIRDKGGAGC